MNKALKGNHFTHQRDEFDQPLALFMLQTSAFVSLCGGQIAGLISSYNIGFSSVQYPHISHPNNFFIIFSCSITCRSCCCCWFLLFFFLLGLLSGRLCVCKFDDQSSSRGILGKRASLSPLPLGRSRAGGARAHHSVLDGLVPASKCAGLAFKKSRCKDKPFSGASIDAWNYG